MYIAVKISIFFTMSAFGVVEAVAAVICVGAIIATAKVVAKKMRRNSCLFILVGCFIKYSAKLRNISCFSPLNPQKKQNKWKDFLFFKNNLAVAQMANNQSRFFKKIAQLLHN